MRTQPEGFVRDIVASQNAQAQLDLFTHVANTYGQSADGRTGNKSLYRAVAACVPAFQKKSSPNASRSAKTRHRARC